MPSESAARRRPRGLQPSPSMCNEVGYYNLFGGFHRTRDSALYWAVVKVAAKQFWRWKVVKFAVGYLAADRWQHRKCDTTDFHHSLGCMADPRARFEDALDWWWKGKPRARTTQ